jgi:alcohol dehydrogenase class IV
VCAALLAPTLAVTFRALSERAPTHPASARGVELALALTGGEGADLPDLLAWLDDLRRTLAVPGLAEQGVTEAEIPQIVAAAARASSTRAHPIPLVEGELTEILTRAL